LFLFLNRLSDEGGHKLLKMKKLISYAFLLIGSIVLLYSCTKDDYNTPMDASQSVKSRSQDCVESLDFKTKEYSYVAFGVPDSELTDGERSLKSVRTSFYEYSICKKTGGKIKAEITSKPELKPEDYQRPLGIQDQVGWTLVNDEGAISIYDAKGSLLKSDSGDPMDLEDQSVELMFNTELIPEQDYDLAIEQMKRQFDLQDLSDDISMFSEATSNGLVKTYIDKNLQREVVKEYYVQNVLTSRRTYMYSTTNKGVQLTSEVFETLKQSMDSDHIMTIIELKEYIL